MKKDEFYNEARDPEFLRKDFVQEDVRIPKKSDGDIHKSPWRLQAEIDHWKNHIERLKAQKNQKGVDLAICAAQMHIKLYEDSLKKLQKAASTKTT
jgi:hypothetical protein